MNPELRDVWQRMRHLGLAALAHANRHAAYMPIENPRWPELSVLQAAHAAELLIKARIAQEHPLLIFEQLPRSTPSALSLDFDELFKSGRTLQWSDLPDRLWAATAETLPSRETFERFGRLRNGIQHFSPSPSQDVAGETLRFVFEVIDPFINRSWGLFAIDFDEEYEPHIYFLHALVSREIPFLVSPEAAVEFDNWDVVWDSASPAYVTLIESRVRAALPPKDRGAA